jgi:hypothetical protein
MNGKRHWPLLLVSLFLLVGALALVLVAAQTKNARKKSTKSSTASESKLAKEMAHRDSLAAAAKADSIRKVMSAKAIADSIEAQRLLDSLALVHADSLKVFRYRKITNEAFGVGERLVFDVNYGFITAGEAVMTVPAYDSIADRKVYRIEFTVNSLPSFSWIYKVEDRYLTFIDVDAIVPLKFEQHIREGTYRRDFIAEFDQVNRVARTSEGQYPIPEYVHDIMSAFYYARTIDFSGMDAGHGIMLSNFYRNKSHDLMVRFLGRQVLEVEAGTFNTIVVEPMVKEGGLFKSEGRIVIWLSDDERKIPVRVNTKVVIGSIDTELKSYSGLVGPLTSRTR